MTDPPTTDDEAAARDARLLELARNLLKARGSLQSAASGKTQLHDDQVSTELGKALQSAQDAGRAPADLDAPAAAAETVRVAGQALRTAPRRLTPEEAACLQLIVRTFGRPALRFTEEGVESPLPNGGNDRWIVRLATRGAKVKAVAKSVGAIFKTGSGEPLLLGTGWRVGPDLLVTNRHVARRMAGDPGQSPDTWTLSADFECWADFAHYGAAAPIKAPVEALVYVAADAWLDLAVLKMPPAGAPAPLEIAWDDPVSTGLEIYVVGHPESYISTEAVSQVFGKADGRKRCSPGESTKLRPDERVFEHDCSTLSGNSGSCALDFDSNRVVGLHYGGVKPDATGAVGETNLCIALAALKAHAAGSILGAQAKGAGHG